MIVANQYVRVRGRVYAKGEIIPDGLPSENIKRLIGLGAVLCIDNKAEDAPDLPAPVDPEPSEEVSKEIDVSDGIVKGTKKRGRRKTG